MTRILLKRGLSSRLSTLSLQAGEAGFATDTGKLYIGNGKSNVLINEIDKPSGLMTTAFYTKVKINDYGQVVSQSNLVESDIPRLAASKISGLGSCALLNSGTASGQVPLLDTSGKLPASMIPLGHLAGSATALISNATTLIPPNGAIPFTMLLGASIATISGDGSLTLLSAGVFLLSYHVSALTPDLHMTIRSNLNDISTQLGGSTARATSIDGTLFNTVSASVAFTISTAGTKYYLVNRSLLPLTLLQDMASLSIIRIM